MENLNAEQVKKAHEHCTTKVICKGCPCWREDKKCTLREDTLALITSQEQRIKELTEENERLVRANSAINNAVLAVDRMAKADTVRKMQEMVKRRASTVGNSYANGETVIIQYCISPQALDQIAKEMMEGEK